jgi:hypothetical protein
MSKDSYLERMEKKFVGLEVENYEVSNTTELNKPIIEIFDFVNSNLVEKIGNKIYFSPMLFYTSTVNPFKQETRNFPLDFSYPYQDKYNFTITIPEGYEVESMPKPINIVMENNIASFKYLLASSGNQVQVSAVMEINYASIPSDYYVVLKDFFGQMVDKQKEKIVLKKI